jgi:molecular chaperone GrpE
MNNKENQNVENTQETTNSTIENEQVNESTVNDDNINSADSSEENTVNSEKENDPVSDLQTEVAVWEDKYKRLYAEFDNFRKRNMRERSDLIKNASRDLMTSLLPVVDDFERAIKANSESQDIDGVKEGFELIHNRFFHILKSNGLTAMDAEGKDFDVEFHEAITSIPVEKKKMVGKVAEVIEKGYFLHDNVVRYAKVVIGK